VNEEPDSLTKKEGWINIDGQGGFIKNAKTLIIKSRYKGKWEKEPGK
jgi:hypothetical protein